MRSRHRWITAISLAAIMLTACTGAAAPPSVPGPSASAGPRASARPSASAAPASAVAAASPDSGTKAGGKPGPVAITVADSQPLGRPSNLPLTEFKRQVEALSSGSMTVTVMVNASADSSPPGSDGPVVDSVRSGAFQMAVVPARAWSAVGVNTLKALQAPFLIESDAHAAALVDDAAISRDALAGLDAVGVTGLTLFPESLRHFFSFGAPILAPADVKGHQVRAISSPDTTALIEALGGTAVDPDGDSYRQGVEDGTIVAADSGFSIAQGTTPRSATATGNLVLYAKIITLVVNSAFWRGLDDAQRDVIARAATATRAWAVANQPSDAAAAASYCTVGGTVVLTDRASIDAFRAAEAPVYATLEADPTTRQLIGAIRGLAAGTSGAAVQACRPTVTSSSITPDGGTLSNGIYRAEFTDDYLKSQGVPDVSEQHGIWTFKLQNGHWTIDVIADNPQQHPHIEGIYQVVGNEIYWRWDNDPGQPVSRHMWSVDANGTLTFVPSTPSDAVDWALGLPLVRVGSIAP